MRPLLSKANYWAVLGVGFIPYFILDWMESFVPIILIGMEG